MDNKLPGPTTDPVAAGAAMHLSEELVHSTVRIETADQSGKTFTGTGFFFDFHLDGRPIATMIVTNRHVLSGMVTAALHLTRKDEAGKPMYGQHVRLGVTDLQRRVLYHPDDGVDLAVLSIPDLVNALAAMGQPAFLTSATNSNLPTAAFLDEVTMFEEILMIGYPNSLWDSANNLPIVRRGLTATPLVRDYEGRKEFVIDAACFPGSSGSPVYLYNQGVFAPKSGGLHMGVRFALVGVLYAGPQHTVEGEIVVVGIPTETRPIPISRYPMNLGFCIKAERILDFLPLILQRLKG